LTGANVLVLTPDISGVALAATSTGNIDWACTSAGHVTASAQTLAYAAGGSVPTKYVPSNCK
jgi:type IV pilus assembly protein PilA